MLLHKFFRLFTWKISDLLCIHAQSFKNRRVFLAGFFLQGLKQPNKSLRYFKCARILAVAVKSTSCPADMQQSATSSGFSPVDKSNVRRLIMILFYDAGFLCGFNLRTSLIRFITFCRSCWKERQDIQISTPGFQNKVRFTRRLGSVNPDDLIGENVEVMQIYNIAIKI